MKICIIFGTRPQIIKLSAMIETLQKNSELVLINTSQHYDDNMAGVFMRELDVSPHYNLGVVTNTQAKQVGEMMIKLEGILIEEKPDLVLVYGDTNSTLAGALTASKLGIPIVHVEAGLRSYRGMPEETNRVVTDHLSTLLFCPTKTAVKNLKKEGITKGVYLTGDLMADLVEGKWEPKDYKLATIHRRENLTEERLRHIIGYLKDKNVILPLHPHTKKMLEVYQIDTNGIKIIEPVGFKEMIELEMHARYIYTDSGGVQREAYLLGVPYEVLRENTEWPELLTYKKGLLGENVATKMTEILNGDNVF